MRSYQPSTPISGFQSPAVDGILLRLAQQNEEEDISQPVTPAAPQKLRIEPAVINPVRAATLGSEVGGIIDGFCCQPGVFVEKDQVITDISKRRYDLIARKAKERVESYEIALNRAETDRAIKKKLVDLDAASRLELSRTEGELEIVEHRLNEARFEYEQARNDLDACQVKAPFTGVIAVRHKEPYEPAAPLEKLVTVMDVSKVYAVANVPAVTAVNLEKGAKMTFRGPNGLVRSGTIDRIEPAIDPKTDTRKFYILLDNPNYDLHVGNVGSLEEG